MTDTPITDARWGWPLNSQRAHLFAVDGEGKVEMISICRRMMFAGAKESDPWKGTHVKGQDCMACVKKAQALDKRLSKTAGK